MPKKAAHEELPIVIRKLGNALEKEGIKPQQAFKRVDTNNDGVIVITEMQKYLAKTLVGYTITGADFKAAF